MPIKTFQNGYPLPATDLNTYLMNQAVMTFASSTARASAISSPNEGMLTWLEDSNKYQYHNGTTWVDLLPSTTPTWSDKSANYTTVSGDINSTIRSTNAAITITISNTMSNPGERIDFIQAGSGQITFAAGSGVTLSSSGGLLKTAGQYSAASVVFGGSGVYYLIGNLG